MFGQKELSEYKEFLKGKTKEELLELEQEIIKEADELDKNISTMEFDLPKKNYAVSAETVRYFLNKQSVQWQYTLAMVGMYDFWTEKNPGKIPYAQLDAILNAIGELKFTGYEEWAKIVALNTYLEPITAKYRDVKSKIFEIATKHSEIQNAIGLNSPISTPPQV